MQVFKAIGYNNYHIWIREMPLFTSVVLAVSTLYGNVIYMQ